MTKQIYHHSPFSAPPCQICFVPGENLFPWTDISMHSFSFMFGIRSMGWEGKLNDKTSIDTMVTNKAYDKQLHSFSLILTSISCFNNTKFISSLHFPPNLVFCLMTSWFGGVTTDKHKRWNDSPLSPFLSNFMLCFGDNLMAFLHKYKTQFTTAAWLLSFLLCIPKLNCNWF